MWCNSPTSPLDSSFLLVVCLMVFLAHVVMLQIFMLHAPPAAEACVGGDHGALASVGIMSSLILISAAVVERACCCTLAWHCFAESNGEDERMSVCTLERRS